MSKCEASMITSLDERCVAFEAAFSTIDAGHKVSLLAAKKRIGMLMLGTALIGLYSDIIARVRAGVRLFHPPKYFFGCFEKYVLSCSSPRFMYAVEWSGVEKHVSDHCNSRVL